MYARITNLCWNIYFGRFAKIRRTREFYLIKLFVLAIEHLKKSMKIFEKFIQSTATAFYSIVGLAKG